MVEPMVFSTWLNDWGLNRLFSIDAQH